MLAVMAQDDINTFQDKDLFRKTGLSLQSVFSSGCHNQNNLFVCPIRVRVRFSIRFQLRVRLSIL